MSNTAVIDIPIDMMDRLGTATFEELAQFAEASITKAGDHARQSIHHLIEVGGALREMRDRMPGPYRTWLQNVGMDELWASKCQRLYVYRNELPAEVFAAHQGIDGRECRPSMRNALRSISHLPQLYKGQAVPYNKTPEERRVTAERMLAEGAPARDVAAMTGISLGVIKRIRNPGGAKDADRRRREKMKAAAAAERALREQEQRAERDRLAKITGKEASVAYAAVRQALAALAKVSGSATHVDAATGYLTAAESRIVAIMQEERASQ